MGSNASKAEEAGQNTKVPAGRPLTDAERRGLQKVLEEAQKKPQVGLLLERYAGTLTLVGCRS